jgi:Putative Actinobacterial Holin-X, holin superfamily III
LVVTPGDASLGELVSQLAHEGVELVEVELRRVRVELRDKAGRAVSALVGGAIAFVFLGLASLALAVGAQRSALGSGVGAVADLALRDGASWLFTPARPPSG